MGYVSSLEGIVSSSFHHHFCTTRIKNGGQVDKTHPDSSNQNLKLDSLGDHVPSQIWIFTCRPTWQWNLPSLYDLFPIENQHLFHHSWNFHRLITVDGFRISNQLETWKKPNKKGIFPCLLDIHAAPRSQEIKHLQLRVLTSALHGFPPRDGCNCKSSTMWQKSSRNRRNMKSAETNHQTAKIHILWHTLARIPKTWKLKIHKARGGTIERMGSVFFVRYDTNFFGGGGDCFCPVSFEIPGFCGWEFENPTRQVMQPWVEHQQFETGIWIIPNGESYVGLAPKLIPIEDGVYKHGTRGTQ